MPDSEYPLEPKLLNAQLDHNMIGKCIFEDLGDQLIYRWPVNERLPYALIELWEAQESNDRWTELEYVSATAAPKSRISTLTRSIPRRTFWSAVSVHCCFISDKKPVIYPPLSPEEDASHYDA